MKKCFDRGVFADGLLQLRLPGFILLILTMGFKVMMIVYNWMSISRENSSYPGAIFMRIPASAKDLSDVLAVFMYIAPVIFCLTLFSFLNKRKGSDFYHSLTQTRVCLYLSLFASIFTWLAGTIVAEVLVSAALYAVLGSSVAFINIIYAILTILAGSLFIAAAMLLAMSITGTVPANLTVFGIILFLPKVIAAIYVSTMNNMLPIADTGSLGLFANLNLNIPIRFILINLIHAPRYIADQSSLYSSFPAIAYTLVFSIIYLCAACLLFSKRKSEAAGKSSPNRALQHIFRCAVTLPISLLIPAFLIIYNVSAASTKGSFWSSYGFMTIIVLFICIAVYFLFELITTKKLKSMLRAAPFLLVVIALDAVFYVGLSSARNSILNEIPKSEDISSINITAGDEYYSSGSYSDPALENVVFTSTSLKNTVAGTLTDNINDLKQFKFIDGSVDYKVTFHMKNGISISRIIRASNEAAMDIDNAIQKENNYAKALTSLPDKNTISRISILGINNTDSTKQLWNCLLSEFNNLSLDNKLSVLRRRNISRYKQNDISSDKNNLNSIDVLGNIGSTDYYSDSIAISSDTPKTAALYAKLIDSQNKSAFDKLTSGGYNVLGLTITAYNYYNSDNIFVTGNSIVTLGSNSDSGNTLTGVFDILSGQADSTVDFSKPYITINGELLDRQSDKSNYFSYIMPLPQESINKIAAMNLK